MFCYRCRAHTLPGQNFCRSCGADLRSVSASTSSHPPAWLDSHPRWQILVEVVKDALHTGFQYITERPGEPTAVEPETSRFKRWGLIAFWAGLAALLADYAGIILILTGIGLMAYARGLFGPVKEASSSRTSTFQAPPSRETVYTNDSPLSPSAEGEGPDYVRSTSKFQPRRTNVEE